MKTLEDSVESGLGFVGPERHDPQKLHQKVLIYINCDLGLGYAGAGPTRRTLEPRQKDTCVGQHPTEAIKNMATRALPLIGKATISPTSERK